jgi:hypothetical protein
VPSKPTFVLAIFGNPKKCKDCAAGLRFLANPRILIVCSFPHIR